MPHEEQLLVAETVLEVREERNLPARDAERVVHETPRQGLVRQRDPRIAKPDQRLLPGVRQIEGVSHFVASCPELHAADPRRRSWVAGRGIGDKRIVEDRRPLAVVGSDVVKHNPAQAGSHFMTGREKDPHRPLGPIVEP